MYFKTLFTLGIFMLFGLGLFGQGASYVYDAKNDINQAKQYTLTLENFSESLRQTELLTKTQEFLSTAEKVLSKVNSVLNDVSYVEMIVRREVYIIRSSAKYISDVRSMKHIKLSDVQRFEATIELFLSDCDKLLDMADKLLSDDYFKMDDSQRVSQLDNISQKLSETQTAMDIYYDELVYENQAASIMESMKNF